MAKSKKNLLLDIVSKLIAIPMILSLLNNMLHTLKSEATMAKKSFFVIVVLALFALVLLSSAWFSVQVLLFLFLNTFQLTLAVSVAIILLLNIVLFAVALLVMKKLAKKLFFPKSTHIVHYLLGQ